MAIGANWKEVWEPVWGAVWEPTLAPEDPIGINWAPIWQQVWGPVWQASSVVIPDAPTDVAGAPTGGTTLDLSLTDNTGGTATHRWQLAPVSTGTFVDAAGATNPSAAGVVTFAATGLTPATEYRVRARSEDVGGESAWVEGAETVWTDNTGEGGSELPRETDGAMVGGGAAVSGVAHRTRVHATSGVLAGAGAQIAGIAEIIVPGVHVTNGAMVGAGAVMAGVAVRRALHITSGVLVGAGAQVSGAAARPAPIIVRSAPPSGNGPALSRRGRNLSTRTR